MTPGTIPTFKAKAANSGSGTTPPPTGGTQSTKTFFLSASVDNGYFDGSTVRTGATYIYQGNNGYNETGFCRFVNVAVPKNAVINSATFAMEAVYSGGGSGGSSGVWRAVATDNATAVPTNPETVAKTVANVAVMRDSGIKTHNVTAIVQEIVSRSGWASGNGFCIVGDVTGATGDTMFYAYDGYGMKPTLTITYTA